MCICVSSSECETNHFRLQQSDIGYEDVVDGKTVAGGAFTAVSSDQLQCTRSFVGIFIFYADLKSFKDKYICMTLRMIGYDSYM